MVYTTEKGGSVLSLCNDQPDCEWFDYRVASARGSQRKKKNMQPSPAFNTIADLVLLHIGTNDLSSSDAKSTTADRLDRLLTKIAGAAPDALVVVAQVIPLGYSSTDWTTYNSKIPGLVEAHAAKGEHMITVDMSKAAFESAQWRPPDRSRVRHHGRLLVRQHQGLPAVATGRSGEPP